MSTNASQPIASVVGQPVRAGRVSPRSFVRAALTAALVALAINLVLWGLARGPFAVSADFPPLQSAASTIFASLAGILAATLVFALLLRVAPWPVAAFRVIAAVALLLSLGGPLSATSEPGASGTAVTLLILMHVVTAAVAVWILPTVTPGGMRE